MTVRADMLKAINAGGARLTFASDPEEFEVLIVGASASGNDNILATQQWIEEDPTSFPLHRYKGRVEATDTGWLIHDTQDDADGPIAVDELTEGMPELTDEYAAYQERLDPAGFVQEDLHGIVLDTVRDGAI